MSQIYSKESFDRFGDDFCELVLSYLTFEQKFTYEQVSKQWQRSIYQKQFDLFAKFKYEHHLGTILRKCTRVRYLICKTSYSYCLPVDDLFNNYFIKYCNNLIGIKCDLSKLSDKTIEKFFGKTGNNLRLISISRGISNANLYKLEKCLNLCTNLREIKAKNINFSKIFINEDVIRSMSKLEKIEFIYSDEDWVRFSLFVQQHRASLKSVRVYIDIHSVKQASFYSLMHGLKQLGELIHLKIELSRFVLFKTMLDSINSVNEMNNLLVGEHLKQIGVNLKNLRYFSLSFKQNNANELPEIIQIINEYFKQLLRLDIRSIYAKDFSVELMSESLSQCKRLTHLTLDFDSYYVINDSFFTDIDKHLPKLQYLCISNANITDIALHSMQKLSKLQTIEIELNTENKTISDSSVYYMINKFRKIRNVFINGKKFL